MVACNGSNCLLRVEPQTMEIRQYPLPDPKTTVRRLDIASDGMIWYVNSGWAVWDGWTRKRARSRNGPPPAGRVPPLRHRGGGRYRLVQRVGAKTGRACPIRSENGAIPESAIPSGGIYGGILRHMRPTRDGNLLIHQTSTNRIILVTVKRPTAKQ